MEFIDSLSRAAGGIWKRSAASPDPKPLKQVKPDWRRPNFAETVVWNSVNSLYWVNDFARKETFLTR